MQQGSGRFFSLSNSDFQGFLFLKSRTSKYYVHVHAKFNWSFNWSSKAKLTTLNKLVDAYDVLDNQTKI